jgi:hypothetical protein
VFWVPIAGPLLGGVIGAAAYDLVIRRILPGNGTSIEPPVDAEKRG